MIRVLLGLVLGLVAALSLWRTEVHKGAAEQATNVARSATSELESTRRADERRLGTD